MKTQQQQHKKKENIKSLPEPGIEPGTSFTQSDVSPLNHGGNWSYWLQALTMIWISLFSGKISRALIVLRLSETLSRWHVFSIRGNSSGPYTTACSRNWQLLQKSPIRTAHANLPMYVEEPLASDFEISLPRAFDVVERSIVRFLHRISMITVDVRLAHSLLL